MKKPLSILVLSISMLASMGAASAETFEIDPSHSTVGFSVRHIFSQVEGQFDEFSGTIHYDADHPKKSWVKATIKVSTVDTRNEKRDNHLRSPDFFDVEKYPEMTFESTKVVAKGDALLVSGKLSLHGVTKKINFPIRVLGVGEHPMMAVPVAGFSAETVLMRSDFGVDSWTDGANVLGDEIAIRLNIEALGAKTGKAAANPCNPCGGKNPCNPCG